MAAAAALLAGMPLAAAQPAPAPLVAAAPAPAPSTPLWAFQASDVPVDPAFHFGVLPNGLRYVIRHNETPKGIVLVRMQVKVGSLDEGDAQRGFAHFVEHMAFQGSARVPEGEMVRLLERAGLAFGADTNAQTGFETTTYQLDLPNNTAQLVDTALMLMRETASELSFPAAAVARERGVVLAEMRERDSWQYREMVNRFGFLDPDARYTHRLPIGTTEALNAATADSLAGFWRAHYVPANSVLVVVGDVDVAAVEAAIRSHFASWAAAPAAAQPAAGPVAPADAGRSAVYLDPALSERLVITRRAAWRPEPDTQAQRREDLLRRIGYAIVNRRLQHIARQPNLPFREAVFGSGDLFRAGRATSLVIDAVDGQWRRAMAVAAQTYRQVLDQGITRAELDEQIANIHTAAEHAAAGAATRGSGELLGAVFALLRDEAVPSDPVADAARIEGWLGAITPEAVLAALKADVVPLDNPLIRFQGRKAPDGNTEGLRTAWNEAMRSPLPARTAATASGFAYADFGAPGRVVADRREPGLGIREIRFANGVKLNLKHTDIEKDKVLIAVNIDGGQMLETRADPLATEMVQMLTTGGLGKHSLDDLQTVLAGHEVSTSLANGPDSFVGSARTTPADLALQLRVLAALITDPGYRIEGEQQYRLAVNTYFTQLNATPAAALTNSIGGILSDQDPRFSVQKVEAYRALTFARLKAAIADRLAHGALEVGLVGDVDEARAIALVGATLGALPVREADFRPYAEQRQRPFTAERTERVVRHTGPANQAMLRLTWPTRDDSDPQAKQVLNMLGRVAQVELTENLRQRLGKAYAPSASSDPSRVWRGYGTFAITASVDVADLAVMRAAMLDTVAALRARPVSADIMLRARQPLVESFQNALKSNGGWLALVARAQSQPDRIARHLKAEARLAAVSAGDVQAAARRYLGAGAAVEVAVLPEGAALPAPLQPAPALLAGGDHQAGKAGANPAGGPSAGASPAAPDPAPQAEPAQLSPRASIASE